MSWLIIWLIDVFLKWLDWLLGERKRRKSTKFMILKKVFYIQPPRPTTGETEVQHHPSWLFALEKSTCLCRQRVGGSLGWSKAELHKHQSIFEMEWMSGNAELTVWSGSRQRLVSTTSAAPSQARPPSDAALKKPGKRRNRHIWKTSNRCFWKDNIDCYLYYLLFTIFFNRTMSTFAILTYIKKYRLGKLSFKKKNGKKMGHCPLLATPP